MMKKLLVVPDLQVPYHSPDFVRRLLRVARTYKPHTIVFIGDLVDLPEVSRWTKGLAGEYSATLQGSLDEAHQILSDLRTACPKADIHVKMGNHDERLEQYIDQYGPALRVLRTSNLAFQLQLDRISVQLQRRPFHPMDGLLALHGHERAYSSVQGKFERDSILKYGTSVIAGHTHSPVLISQVVGLGADRKEFFGMNVGHGMDMSKAGYLKDNWANWTQAFGIVQQDDDGGLHPRLVLAPNGRFIWEGKRF